MDHARPRSQSLQAMPGRQHAQSIDSLPHAPHHGGSSQLSTVPEDSTPRLSGASRSMDVLQGQRAGSGVVQVQQVTTYSQPSAAGAAQADFVVNGKGYSKLQVW